MDIDELIKEIIYMVFEGKVDLDDPDVTIRQTNEQLRNKGMYPYNIKQ